MTLFWIIVKWTVIVNLLAMIGFGLILVYDRIKYGVWATDYPKEDEHGDK